MRLLGAALFLFAGSLGFSAPLPDYGAVGEFALTERSGNPFTEKDLAGRPWVVNFFFTRCSGPCPILSTKMSGLQSEIPAEAGLLSITVNPEYDSPEMLARYASRFKPDPGRWFFVTGPREQVYDLIRGRLLNAADKNPEARGEGDAFIHSQKFVLLDAAGRIRGFYDGEDEESTGRLVKDLRSLLRKSRVPELNASLNLSSAFFLLAGYFFIRRKRVLEHKVSMGLALGASAVFLASYLIYHARVGSVPFQGQGPIRKLYFSILLTHTVLAAAILPLAWVTLKRALKGKYEEHRRIARWTFPIWLYVSVTGVVVYYMLYRI